MGNRAVIAFSEAPKALCVYIHWNGSRPSVEGFLQAARTLKLEPSMELLGELIRGYLNGSVYVEPFGETDTDNGDNGVYLIDRQWNIVGRAYAPGQDEVDPVKTENIAQDTLAAWARNHPAKGAQA